MRKLLLSAASIAFTMGALLVSCAAQASAHGGTISAHATSGAYTLTLKVLPAESFAGPHSAMAWDGGAKPDLLSAKPAPNHHLVVFVKKNGKPVEKGNVSIRYRMLKPSTGPWHHLPVARMHVAGKSPATTHYGNNVMLTPGSYAVWVKVGDAPAHVFRFALKGG